MWKTTVKPVLFTLGGLLGIFILSAIIFALTGCTAVETTPEPVIVGPSEVYQDRPLVDPLIYNFQKVDGSASMTISFQSGWSCFSSEGDCFVSAVTFDCTDVTVANSACEKINQHSFLYGDETVAREEIIDGLSTLRLIVTPGWVLTSWEWGDQGFKTEPVEVEQPTLEQLDSRYQPGGLPEGPVRYFLAERDDTRAVPNEIRLTYEESGTWSCAFTNPVGEVDFMQDCIQLVGTQTMFFYGLNKVAEEELIGGLPTGRLIIEPPYILIAWNVIER